MAAPVIIDCDVHPTVPGMKALQPYLDDHWREAVVRRGIDDQTTISYPTLNPLTFRSDWKNATDYPHRDHDDPAQALPLKMTEEQRRAIFRDNARAVYRV